MTTIADGLRAIYGQQARAPASSPATAAVSALRASLARLPNSRESRDPADLTGLLAWFEDQLGGYPGDSRQRIIGILRRLAEADDDVAGSLGDLQSLCGAGFTVDFTGGKRATSLAKQELEAWALRMFPEGGGLTGLIANQVAEIALAGASSCEWYPERNRRGVAGVAVVPAEEVRIRRDPATQELIYRQRAGVLAEGVELNPRTYLYAAPRTTGRNPLGVPLFVSALFSLDRKRQLSDAEQRVINLMARSALVQATAPIPTPEALGFTGESDPGYEDAVAAYFNNLADTIVSGSESGVYIGPDGTDIKVLPLNQTASGAPEITQNNQHRVWNALKTLPFMRGEMDSTTQALAQVTVPILHAQAVSIQQTIARQLEFGMNLHLALRGIPAQAWVAFTPPKSPFLLDEATALLRKAEAFSKLAELFGPAIAQTAMNAFDITEGDYDRAPDWWQPAAPSQPTPPGGTTP